MINIAGINLNLITQAAIPIAVFVGVILLAFLARRLLFVFLRRLARRTETPLDNILVDSIKGASVLWCFIFGIYFALASAEVPPTLAKNAGLVLSSLIIMSVTLAAANTLVQFMIHYVTRTKIDIPITGLSSTIIRIVVLGTGTVVLLGNLGVSITPLVTAMGVGGLAAALAFRSTLANLFSGVHLLIEKPIRVGDYIKLGSGEEGYVIDIGWRTTRIRMLPNNVIILPNEKLAESIITNYNLPERAMSLLIRIGVSYDSDPDHIERILIEETKAAAGEVPGLLEDPPPFVRFIPGFGDFSLDFTLICRVAEFVDQYLVQHELRKRIFRRFKAEGITIPFPIRTIELKGEGAPLLEEVAARAISKGPQKSEKRGRKAKTGVGQESLKSAIEGAAADDVMGAD